MGVLAIGATVLVCILGAFLGGRAVQGFKGAGWLSGDTRDAIKLIMGTLGTLSGLVLGLMVGRAQTSFNRQEEEIFDICTKIMMLDRTLARVGPEVRPLRTQLRALAIRGKDRLWPDGAGGTVAPAPADDADLWLQALASITPRDEGQRLLLARATTLSVEVLHNRWLIFQQSRRTSSLVLLCVLSAWFCLTFFCLGLIVPREPLVTGLVVLCVASVSVALHLLLELEQPFSGLLRIPSDALMQTISLLGT